jgi:hypothetical protein
MPTFGISAPGFMTLNRRAHHLRIAVLTCLLTAAPLAAGAQEQAQVEPARLNVSRNAPIDLDDILLRLSRIETLVRDIHQLIQQLPAAVAIPFPAPPPAPPVSATPAISVSPSVPPVVLPVPLPVQPVQQAVPAVSAQVSAPLPSGILGFFDKWGTSLAASVFLVLILMMAQRHRREKKSAPPAAAPAPTSIAPEPALSPPAKRAPTLAPVQLTPAEPTPLQPAKVIAPAPKPAAPAPIPVAPAVKPAARSQLAKAPETTVSQQDQALELAEIMLTMGLGHGAAKTLAEQIRHEPKQALKQWLKLLEIYRKNGQQEEFEHSAEELRQHFNVQPEDWQEQKEIYRSIEEYPHIAARLTELWGKPSCLNYLGNLLADNRGGARAGFPQTVAEELLMLSAMLRADGIVPEADAAVDSV